MRIKIRLGDHFLRGICQRVRSFRRSLLTEKKFIMLFKTALTILVNVCCVALLFFHYKHISAASAPRTRNVEKGNQISTGSARFRNTLKPLLIFRIHGVHLCSVHTPLPTSSKLASQQMREQAKLMPPPPIAVAAKKGGFVARHLPMHEFNFNSAIKSFAEPRSS